jgi:serine/threonine-protein kinase
MEYLEGETLRQKLKRRGSLPLLEAVEILQQAARGLNAAHKLGIVHRDLKPDNILLTQDDDGQVLVKIVDFGIAKMRESTSHTMTGLAVGTPAYMSVEQASGMRSDELDGRSDIYSLGVVAYEIITGRVPFQADTPLAYLKKHLIEPPASITLTRPDLHISPQMDQAVMKALQKERTDRYPTAPDFAGALAMSISTKPADIPETEFAIRDLDRTEPEAPATASVHSSSQPAVASQPVPVPTMTLARRRSAVLGIAAVAVVLVAMAAAAWYVLSSWLATRRTTPAQATVHDAASAPSTNSTPTPIHPEPPNPIEVTQDLSHKLKSATAQGDLFYRQGKYDTAVVEYKKALAMAPDNVTLSTKIRHAQSAKETERRLAASSLPGNVKPLQAPKWPTYYRAMCRRHA